MKRPTVVDMDERKGAGLFGFGTVYTAPACCVSFSDMTSVLVVLTHHVFAVENSSQRTRQASFKTPDGRFGTIR